LRSSRDFAAGRRVDVNEETKKVDGKMSRLYVIESALTITGINADERIAARSCDIAGIAAGIAHELGIGVEGAIDAAHEKVIEELVKDLKSNRGSSLVIAGSGQPA